MDFVQRIFLKDWPLIVTNRWLETLIDIENPNYIRPRLCEAIVQDYGNNQRYDKNRFREILFERINCDGELCRGLCDRKCATAGNIEKMPEFDRFSNFKPLYSQILSHFFFKLNDKINVYHIKYRIGILVLYFVDEDVNKPQENDVFIEKEKHLILNQLSNHFYVTDFALVDAKYIFSHIRNFIDSIVIIIDSNFQQSHYLDEYCSVIQCFSFLKIFLVKTVDMLNYDNVKIMDYFTLKFPRNKIVIYDWLEKAKHFPQNMKKELPLKLRLKVAIRSRFVKNPTTNYEKS